LKVATCRFPVSGDVDEDARYIKGFIEEAARNQADVVHFSEAALSGYAGVDVPDFNDYDWDKLRAHTKEIMGLAEEHRIWVVLGSAHYLCPEEKPTNCLYIISDEGEIVDRYDKAMVLSVDEVYHNGTPSNHPRAENRQAQP
jgi:predicted amidohydrolase